MEPAEYPVQEPVSPQAYHRMLAGALHLDALTLINRLRLLDLYALAVQLAQQRCPPPLPAGPGEAPRVYREESLLLLALLRRLWRLSYRELHDWLVAWPALALACGLPPGPDGGRTCPVQPAVQSAARGRGTSQRDALPPAGARRAVDGADPRPRSHH